MKHTTSACSVVLGIFVFCSNLTFANESVNASASELDIQTIFKKQDEDTPDHELVGYTLNADGLRVSIRATNNTDYNTYFGYCDATAYKGGKRVDEVFVSFTNSGYLGSGYNTIAHANFQKIKQSSEIDRIKIGCDWSPRYSEPDESIEFKFVEFVHTEKGYMASKSTVTNNSSITVGNTGCTYTGYKDKQILINSFEYFYGKIKPGDTIQILAKLINIAGTETITEKLLAEVDEHVMYCGYLDGPEY